MKNHYEMRFGGSGGQGLMIIGDVLSRAVGIYEGKEVVLTKSYGPESRGGACRSELIADDDNINYPTVTSPSFVLAMSQLSCDKYHSDLKKDGVLLVDSTFVSKAPDSIKKVYSIPMTQICKEVTGKVVAANVVALGAIAVLGNCANVESVRKSVIEQFPESFRESNEKAFNAGVEAASKVKEQN